MMKRRVKALIDGKVEIVTIQKMYEGWTETMFECISVFNGEECWIVVPKSNIIGLEKPRRFETAIKNIAKYVIRQSPDFDFENEGCAEAIDDGREWELLFNDVKQSPDFETVVLKALKDPEKYEHEFVNQWGNATTRIQALQECEDYQYQLDSFIHAQITIAIDKLQGRV